MRNKLRLLTVIIFFHATSSFAMPMLSADGSSLTGLDVGGTIYDVMFGDGFVEDTFAGITFNAARIAEATAVAEEIGAALTGIGGVATFDIAGCFSWTTCLVFIPTTVIPSPFEYSNEGAFLFAGALGADQWTLLADVASLPGGFGSFQSPVTLATYSARATAVPLPATLALLSLGLAGLGFGRRKG